MRKSIWTTVSIGLIAATILSACGGGAAAPTSAPAAPTTAPAAPTTAPAEPTAAMAEPTAAMAEPTAAMAEPTAAMAEPTAGGMAETPKITGQVTLWHAYGTGSSEEKVITSLIEQARSANPDAKIDVLQVPFDQVFNKWQTEIAAGGGPDLLVAPNDSLGDQVRADLLLPLDDKLTKDPAVAPLAYEGMTVDGKLYGVPQVFKAVALYYNKDKVPTPPKTTDELLQMVKDGKASIILNQNNYHNFGFFPAFGGKLLDDTGKCVADQGGFAEAMQYLVDLKAAGGKFETDGGKADTLFRTGEVDMIINGPWVLGDYKKDLGDKLGVAPGPAGPKGPFQPLTGVDGFYVNVNTQNPDGALALAEFLSGPQALQAYVEGAGTVPVRTDVEVKDPLVTAFAEASAAGFARPQSKEFAGWWTPFGDMVTKVLEGTTDAKTAVAEACSAMNKANGK